VLRMSFRVSLTRPKVAVVDGEVAAIWGMGGDILSDTGIPWLLTTAAIERMPVTFIKQARIELARMLARKRRLENHVLAEYSQAVRLLEVLGFTLADPAPVGRNRVLFRRFWIEGGCDDLARGITPAHRAVDQPSAKR
jgi:hypothetical protein